MYIYLRLKHQKLSFYQKSGRWHFFFQMRLEKVFFTRTNAVSVSHQISLVFDDLRGHVSFSDKNQISFFLKCFAPIDLSSRRIFFSMYYFGGVRKVSGRSDNFVKNRRFSLADTNSPCLKLCFRGRARDASPAGSRPRTPPKT